MAFDGAHMTLAQESHVHHQMSGYAVPGDQRMPVCMGQFSAES